MSHVEPERGGRHYEEAAISGKPLFNMVRSDTARLDWIEHVGAQIWRNKKGNWTVQVMTGGKVIQPTRATLRAAIEFAHAQWEEAP